MKLRYPLHIHISTLFAILIMIVGGMVGGICFRISSSILETGASELSQRIARETVRDFAHIVAPAEMAVRMLSQGALGRAASQEERRTFLTLMREALNSSHELASIYAGFANEAVEKSSSHHAGSERNGQAMVINGEEGSHGPLQDDRYQSALSRR